ncbi:MAG: hypothetical protein IID15_02675 [Candidatus Marinimicrobia bacterium]|nr:hypothetical protein [Candidatus Neomarinimicrobiota bacterium]
METTYITFQRPDGSIFHKLTTISKEQIAAYKQAGCKVASDHTGKKVGRPKATARRTVTKKADA